MNPKFHVSLNRKILFGIVIIATIFLAILGIRKFFFVSAQAVSMGEGAGAVASLSTKSGKTFFGATEDVILQVSITNPNDYTIRILKWFTPLEGVQEPLFTVLRDGTPVTYLGPIYKRAAPTEQDYITLSAGESLNTEVNLSTYYDLSTPGNYEISYDVTSIQLYMEVGNKRPNLEKVDRLTSNALKLYIDGRSTSTP